MAIHIVTDSTCDLPGYILSEYNINLVPLNVHFDENTYKDKFDLKSEEFYQKLEKSSVHPETSQPSPGEFVSCYQDIASPKDTIISIHLSSKLSGTVQAANIAKEMLPEFDIRIIDSHLASLAMGLVVKDAAEARNKGNDASEIIDKIYHLLDEVTLYFFVDTMEYLQKGGRIGKAQAFMGSLLDIKPVLTIDSGEIVPVEKVRTKKKAIAKVIELLQEEKKKDNVQTGLLYSGDQLNLIENIETQIMENFNCQGTVISPFGPVIGVHLGSGAIGICMTKK